MGRTLRPETKTKLVSNPQSNVVEFGWVGDDMVPVLCKVGYAYRHSVLYYGMSTPPRCVYMRSIRRRRRMPVVCSWCKSQSKWRTRVGLIIQYTSEADSVHPFS